MTKESLVSFLKSNVKPYLQHKWSGYVFLVLEGGVLLVRSKEELVVLLHKYSDFGARIWTISEMINHVIDFQGNNLKFDFEFVSSSFDKIFEGKIENDKELVRIAKTHIYSTIFWRVLLNRDHFPRLYSILDVKNSKSHPIPANIMDMSYELTDDSKLKIEELFEYSSNWPIDAETSLRDSFVGFFSDDESVRTNPIHKLSNWERKLLLVMIKNEWNSIEDFDYEIIFHKTRKNKEFVKKNLNLRQLTQAKNYIDTLWTEKSSLSTLKSTDF